MKMIWFLISMFASFGWFSFAVGILVPSSWVTTVAFVLLGINCMLTAMKKLVGLK